jgi:predicted metal-binding protein
MNRKGDTTGIRYKNVKDVIRKVGPPPLKKVPRHRPLEIPISNKNLRKDLKKYADIAVELGAEEARIFAAKDIPIDPRVGIKCAAPQCGAYGSSSMCPPSFKLTKQEAQEIVHAYNWSIIFRVIEDPYKITGPSGLMASNERIRYIDNIADALQGEAYYDGHVYALGLTGGPCKIINCEKFPNCSHLKTGVCRFPLRAKPSSSGLLIDHIKLMEKIGWKTVLAGHCIWPEDIPENSFIYYIGIILID